MLVSSNLTEGGGFFQGRNLRRAMDVCVCLLGADGRGWKEESTLFRPAPRGQHGFESRREGRPWMYKCCCVRTSVNVRWNGRGWPRKVPRSSVPPPEGRIGKGIGIEKQPIERYRKSRTTKNGSGKKKRFSIFGIISCKNCSPR
jgi:hypothetical protein